MMSFLPPRISNKLLKTQLLPGQGKKTPPINKVRRSSLIGKERQAEMARDYECIGLANKSSPIHVTREVKQEKTRGLWLPPRPTRADSGNSISSSMSIQTFELCDDATTPPRTSFDRASRGSEPVSHSDHSESISYPKTPENHLSKTIYYQDSITRDERFEIPRSSCASASYLFPELGDNMGDHGLVRHYDNLESCRSSNASSSHLYHEVPENITAKFHNNGEGAERQVVETFSFTTGSLPGTHTKYSRDSPSLIGPSDLEVNIERQNTGSGTETMNNEAHPLSKLPYKLPEGRSISKDYSSDSQPNRRSDPFPFSNPLSPSDDDDKFTVKEEFLSTEGDKEAPRVSVSSARKSHQRENVGFLQTTSVENYGAPNMASSFDDHNFHAVKTDTMEQMGPRSCSTEGEIPYKEVMDVKSFRQRAEALEGLLEMSAELLEQNR